MRGQVVGRELELRSVDAFLDGRVEGPTGLVLEGEPGIGKSTVWLAGVTAARERGLRVLSSRPAEAEQGLAHAGLADLFEDVLDDVLPRLSPPRRRALEAALLLADPAPEAVDSRALGISVRDALGALVEHGPPVVAIDDLQWLDVASAGALAFALRRLDASPVLLLLARRASGGLLPSELEQSLQERDVRRLSLGPLSVGALHTLLRERMDRSFARQTLLRIHEHSGGNPFFALELARALEAEVDPTQPLPVPQTLEGLVRARLAGLPASSRDALAIAAAVGAPSKALLLDSGVEPRALDAALQAHVIEVEGGTIRFTHPLLSSVLYGDLAEDRRRRVHRRVAEIVDDPLARARHLALATEATDDEIAAILDEAVRTAADRGAAAVGAELAEHALRLTGANDTDDRRGRALTAARAHRAAGEWTRATTIVGELLAEGEVGPRRAEALVLLSELEAPGRAVSLLEEALREEPGPALQALVRGRLALAMRFSEGFVAAHEEARLALELADDLDDDALRVDALSLLTFLGCAVGDPEAEAHAMRAHELAVAVGDAGLLAEAHRALANVLEVQRDVVAARAMLEADYEEWHDRDELRSAHVLGTLAWIELWGGRWELAAEYASRAHEIEVQYGLEVPWFLLPIAVVAVHRGELELARASSERALKLGEAYVGLHTPVHLGIMGVAALQGGEPRVAAEWFAEAEAQTTRLGWGEAGKRWWSADHVESLLELGELDEAVRILDAWEADAIRLRREWILAHVKRCRGLVAAALGEVDEAASLLEDAVARHERVGDLFGSSRALLALGVVRRRGRQKRGARDAIEAALAGFERLGAATWILRARAELGRIGGRTREPGLTAAERRVATLVADGRTNREVAAALFLGERTVETHLSHVYAKLGVRSRAELARTFRADEQSSGGLTIPS